MHIEPISPEIAPTPRRVVAIVNPAANDGRARASWDALSGQLHSHYPAFEVQFTNARGHGTELSRSALEAGAQLVLAFGGDGTANEALGGFVDENGQNRFPDACLGIIAAGTGGDFQRLFGKDRPERQLPRFLTATPRKIDYGVARLTGTDGAPIVRPFLNVASAGISGEVARRVNETEHQLGPTATYIRASLQSILHHRNHQVEIRYGTEEAKRVDLSLACIANGQYFGSGMWVCPDSRIDDGAFDVLEATGLSRTRLVVALAKVFRGKHRRTQGIRFNRCASVELRPVDRTAKLLVEVDGEQPGALPASFSICPRGIWIQAAFSNATSSR